MTRKIFSTEECTDDDLNAVIDDISMSQMLAIYPYDFKDIAIVSKVIGDPDTVDSEGINARILALPIIPLRGDFLWIRYGYKNATTQNASGPTMLYRLSDIGLSQTYAEITKSHSKQASITEVVDVLDLSSVPTFGDLSGRRLLLEMFVYWPDDQEWFDSSEETVISGSNSLLSLVWRSNDDAIYLVGSTGDYYFWDQAHDADDLSPLRNENPPTWTRRSYTANHPFYGMIYFAGGISSGLRSRMIHNDVDHYATGSPDSDGDDYHAPGGLSINNETEHDVSICVNGDKLVAVNTRVPVPTPSPAYSSRGALHQEIFRDLNIIDPAWVGTATEILNDGSGNTHLPQSDGTHPDGSGLDPEIWDTIVLSDDPEDFGDIHYFARYEWQGHANVSMGTVYQHESDQFELLADLSDFYDNDNLTYPQYAYIVPGVQKHNPEMVGIAVWEHVKIATNNHTIALKILRRTGVQGSPGTWTFETVDTTTLLTDVQAGVFTSVIGSRGAAAGGVYHVDYAFDYNGNEHIAYSKPKAATTNHQIYYRFKNNHVLNPVWTAQKQVSNGTAWDVFHTSGISSSIYVVSLLKDNNYVPWRGTDIRIAWTAKRWDNVFKTFLGGLQSSTGEDDISIYAPEIFMNDRDDTAGPEDMLW